MAGRAWTALPAERWDIRFSICGEENRKMLISGRGRKNRTQMAKWAEMLKNLQMEICAGNKLEPE